MNQVASRLLWDDIDFAGSNPTNKKPLPPCTIRQFTKFHGAMRAKAPLKPCWRLAINTERLRHLTSADSTMITLLEDVFLKMQPERLGWYSGLSPLPSLASVELLPPSRLSSASFWIHDFANFDAVSDILRYCSNTLMDLQVTINPPDKDMLRLVSRPAAPAPATSTITMSELFALKSCKLWLNSRIENTPLGDVQSSILESLMLSLPEDCEMATMTDQPGGLTTPWRNRSDIYLDQPVPYSKKRKHQKRKCTS
jgi:hypothetical protein